MKKTTLILIVLLPVTAGCDLSMDFSGLGEAFSDLGFGSIYGRSGGGGNFTPTLQIFGTVSVGEYPITSGEARILLFAEADSLNPVDSVDVGEGEYHVDLGANPTADQCRYVAQARRWDGELSPFVPLIADPPVDCLAGAYDGGHVELPAYAPLAEPFEIRGRILVDGEPVGLGAAQAYAFVHRGPDMGRMGPVTTDADGWYSVETTDRALWFAACRYVHVEVSSGVAFESIELYGIPIERCASSRTMPEIRQGSIKAAAGRLMHAPSGKAWDPDFAEAVIELRPIGDSGLTPIPAQLLDDGSFHIWFPYEIQSPTCDWEVTVLLAGEVYIRQPLPEAYGCVPPYNFDLWLDPGVRPESATLTMDVFDPVDDHTGLTDVTSMQLSFNPGSGYYTLKIEAHESAPFQDSIRININLYNPQAGTFFSRTMVDRMITEPRSSVELSGYSDALLWWRANQEVFTNSLEGTPNPPNATLFRSSVNHFPLGYLTNEDVISFEKLATPAVLIELPPGG